MNSGAVQEKSRSFAAVYRVAGHRLSHRASHEAWILEQVHHPHRYLFHRVHQEPDHHVRRDKAALFQWVQGPPGDRSRRKQPGQAWR